MKSTNDNFNYVLRFEKGELLITGLTDFVAKNNLRGAWIMGLGGLAWAELGFYDLPTKTYQWSKFEEPLELTSMSGNIAWQDDKPMLHLHATVSDAAMQAKGGHLKEAEVAGTVEVFIHMLDEGKGLNRVHDDATGLNLLNI